jgi:hypothetical protein
VLLTAVDNQLHRGKPREQNEDIGAFFREILCVDFIELVSPLRIVTTFLTDVAESLRDCSPVSKRNSALCFLFKGTVYKVFKSFVSTAGDTCGNNRRHLRSAFKQPQVISGRHGVISGHHGSFPALWGHFRLLLSHFWLLETISATMKTYQPLQCHGLSLGSHFL